MCVCVLVQQMMSLLSSSDYEASMPTLQVSVCVWEGGCVGVGVGVCAHVTESSTLQQMVSLLCSSDYAQASMPTLQVQAGGMCT